MTDFKYIPHGDEAAKVVGEITNNSYGEGILVGTPSDKERLHHPKGFFVNVKGCEDIDKLRGKSDWVSVHPYQVELDRMVKGIWLIRYRLNSFTEEEYGFRSS